METLKSFLIIALVIYAIFVTYLYNGEVTSRDKYLKDKVIYLDKNIKITSNGLPNQQHKDIIDVFKENFINEYLSMTDEKKSSDLIVGALVKKTIKQIIREEFGKNPEVRSHILRI